MPAAQGSVAIAAEGEQLWTLSANKLRRFSLEADQQLVQNAIIGGFSNAKELAVDYDRALVASKDKLFMADAVSQSVNLSGGLSTCSVPAGVTALGNGLFAFASGDRRVGLAAASSSGSLSLLDEVRVSKSGSVQEVALAQRCSLSLGERIAAALTKPKLTPLPHGLAVGFGMELIVLKLEDYDKLSRTAQRLPLAVPVAALRAEAGRVYTAGLLGVGGLTVDARGPAPSLVGAHLLGDWVTRAEGESARFGGFVARLHGSHVQVAGVLH